MSKTISCHNLACIDNLSYRLSNFTYMLNKAYYALNDEMEGIPNITELEELNSCLFFLCNCLESISQCSSELTELKCCLYSEQDYPSSDSK